MSDSNLSPAPVPFPAEDDIDEEPPTRAEVDLIFGAIVTAGSAAGPLTELQDAVVTALCEAMTGWELYLSLCDPVSPAQLAEGLARRDRMFRVRILQSMMLPALLVRPFPEEVAYRVGEYAHALSLDDMVHQDIQNFGPQSHDAAMVDFARNGYAGEFLKVARPVLHTDHDVGDGWGVVDNDPELAAMWANLEHCPDGSLGRGVFDFYTSRNFTFPGLAGSAPPLLAQHDWVHVLGDYGTTLEAEIEVFSLIARADDDARGFSLLAMVIGLFETGQVDAAAGLFEADQGHLSTRGMAVRMADAMRRGAQARPDGEVPKDFLGVDWFAYASLPVEEVRERFQLPPKSQKAIDVGSAGTWDEAGFSAYQLEHCDLSVLDRYRKA